MKVFSYVVARDFGFAPNPFFGVCTLATCKPNIRKHAQVGDWVVGTGAKTRYGLQGHLVFAMRVDGVLSFEEYWTRPEYRRKRPLLRGSLAQAYGDNIYHRSETGRTWIQEDSHHSREGGRTNRDNLRRDTSVDRVLVSSRFWYFGESAPRIPQVFRNFEGADLCANRGHKCLFPPLLPEQLASWVATLGEPGCIGDPAEFTRARELGE